MYGSVYELGNALYCLKQNGKQSSLKEEREQEIYSVLEMRNHRPFS